jgi:hypothetical protein
MMPQHLFQPATTKLGLCLMALGGCASTQGARFHVLVGAVHYYQVAIADGGRGLRLPTESTATA